VWDTLLTPAPVRAYEQVSPACGTCECECQQCNCNMTLSIADGSARATMKAVGRASAEVIDPAAFLALLGR
jgi:hypothetical protein